MTPCPQIPSFPRPPAVRSRSLGQRQYCRVHIIVEWCARYASLLLELQREKAVLPDSNIPPKEKMPPVDTFSRHAPPPYSHLALPSLTSVNRSLRFSSQSVVNPRLTNLSWYQAKTFVSVLPVCGKHSRGLFCLRQSIRSISCARKVDQPNS